MPELPSDPELIREMRERVAHARREVVVAIAEGRGTDAWRAAQIALESRGRFGIRMGLERSTALLAALGSPEERVRGALVAGTNGKGSVVALVSAALRAAGVRHATTPKPHLVSYRERVQIDGRPLPPLPFAQSVARALDAADQIEARVGPATEFELLVGAVFDALREKEINTAIVEVGLGGRLDATHAWDGGVAVVTNVGLDHQQYLGDTIEAIANEKAAIIMRGNHAVTGASERGGALDVIRHHAQRAGAPLTIAHAGVTRSLGRSGIEVELEGRGRVHVGLLGRHQGANAAVAAATLDALGKAGIVSVNDEQLRHGFATARWAGRLELIPGALGSGDERDLLLDGAHNEDGAAALAASLGDLAPELRGSNGTHAAPLVLILAVMADKSVAELCTALAAAPELRTAQVICTSVGDVRSLAPEQLVAQVRTAGLGASVCSAADPLEALMIAAQQNGPIIVAGSLYLVGAIRSELMRRGTLPDDGSRDDVAGSSI
ncbi:MAG: bifunctional folylpolyglutamate synthase/dihydrofolate synthase [bacterium]|nr:bifunctional folylpolyglutamate synthase/dihydrofolate synthase [Candidatus Aquidulcis sp.]